MADESDPVEPDENILRSIPRLPSYYDPALPRPITRLAFKPSSADKDGLSVFRAEFATPEEVAALKKPKGCRVAMLSAAAFYEQKLTITPAPLPPNDPRGHALIPELNTEAEKNKSDKQKLKDIQIALAEHATLRVVHDSLPDDNEADN